MHALSEQFLLLDKMRASAGIHPTILSARAGMNYFRFLKLLHRLETPRKTEIAALTSALHDTSLSDSRRVSPSEARHAGTAAAHATGVQTGRRLIRGLRIAPPPANSGEGGRG